MIRSEFLNYLALLPGVCYLTELVLLLLLQGNRAYNFVLSLLWCAGQLGVLAILVLISRERANGRGIIHRLSLLVPAAGAMSYTLHHVLYYSVSGNLKILLPTGALLTGIGMTMVGIQLFRNSAWTRFRKIVMLSTGLYPFIIMLPVLIVTGHPDETAIMLWGVPWLLAGLGWQRS